MIIDKILLITLKQYKCILIIFLNYLIISLKNNFNIIKNKNFTQEKIIILKIICKSLLNYIISNYFLSKKKKNIKYYYEFTTDEDKFFSNNTVKINNLIEKYNILIRNFS